MADQTPVALAMSHAEQCWSQRSGWTALYNSAYEFAIPQRRPGGAGKDKSAVDRIFDMTSVISSVHFAGNLQRQIFPAGQAPFYLETGPVLASRLPRRQIEQFNRQLEQYSAIVTPFMVAGDFDTAVQEMCLDLGVGTGALLPMRGTHEQPVIFYAVPFDELAIKQDAWGRVGFVSWKREVEIDAIRAGFPNGRFNSEFKDRAKANPYQEITLYQDFGRRADGLWEFKAYTRFNDDFIAREVTRTQPIAVSRYFRVPGEAYGRGPILMALPSIKTLNKAQELALKSAAIQMLGIWAYRAGGTFNPDTVRVGPGQFWPMQSTGGILGPDVSRIDPASGRIDIARLVIDGMQSQVREALLDNRIQDTGRTPRSASEIAAQLRQNAELHIGAFGRMTREIAPVIVPRVCEILASFNYLPTLLSFNELMVAISVRSPMATALKADQMTAVANYIDMVTGVVGPQLARRYVDQDKAVEYFRDALMVPRELVPSEPEQQRIDTEIETEQAAAVVAEGAAKAAPQLVQSLAEAA